MKRFTVTTLGCKVNQYDSQALAAALVKLGLTAADRRDGPPADLVVVNTCCVTATAMRKSRQAIRKALRAAPHAAVMVTGCYSDYDGRRIAGLLADLGVPPQRTALVGHHGDLNAALARVAHTILGNQCDYADPLSGSAPSSASLVPGQPCRAAVEPLGGMDGCMVGHGDARIIASPESIRTRRLAAVKSDVSATDSLGPIDRFAGHQRAFVKVQDGCDAFCAYCIVPFTRPRVWSRGLGEILDECRRLVAGGHKEIVLCGVFLGAFGRPTALRRRWNIPTPPSVADVDVAGSSPTAGGPAAGPANGDHGNVACVFARGGTNTSAPGAGASPPPTAPSPPTPPSSPSPPAPAYLGDLLRAVAQLPGLWRVRLSSLEPLDVTDDLLSIAVASPAVAPHFHLPLQSGSGRILRRMNRQYTVDDFRRTVDRIRSTLDRPALTTDIIVGFPGETDDDFAATLAVARQAGFAKIHSFPFSPVEGTAAWTYRHQAPPSQVVATRMAELADLDRRLAADFRALFIGATLEALVEADGEEEDGPKDLLEAAPRSAMTDRYMTVNFATLAARDRAPLTGQVVRLRITRTTRAGLAGELVG